MDYFVSFGLNHNEIDLIDPILTFGIIFTIILILIGITCKNNNNSFFDTPTTASLRGIAVLFLIFGHLSFMCLQQKMFFNLGGYWAVIIFLFISGYGLYQRYQLNNISGIFWKKRISNLYPALWVTLVLFIFLDYFLLNLCYPLQRILFSILGIHLNEIPIINTPVWFIQYIMMQYLVYWLISKFTFPDIVKLIGLFVICFCIAILVDVSPISCWCKIWTLYTIAFPVGVLFGKYQKQIRTFITEYLNNKIFLLIPLIILLAIFLYWDDFLPDIFYLRTIKPLALIIPIILSLIIYERINLQSTFLVFLGNYSYEIYLLHFPFMVKYDFFLFRDPLYIFFFAYFVSLLILSYILSKTSILINNNLSILGAKITNKIRKR
jgi:peptidoglycan/LPS O-acetylase OafA/YrhL